MRRAVLVGGGHAHVEVLRRWARRPVPGARLALVVDRTVSVYSGMVPGFVAGRYRAGELEIELEPLARRAGAELILAEAVRVDAKAARVELRDGGSVAYDLASLDVGSTVAGLELPGVAEHALATRPIGRFVQQVDAALESARAGARRAVVVGGGAAGVELAFALRARLASARLHASVTLVEAGPELLGGRSPALARLARAAARARGIEVRCGAAAESVRAGRVELRGGESLACDLALWVAGAAPVDLLRASALPLDARGFARVEPTFRVSGATNLFAAGDCASLEGFDLPKAGVYAVRAGPLLARNLCAWLRGGALRRYRPQRDFLSLLNLGDGTALGARFGVAFEGRWVMALKDRIDRRFVARFR